MDTEIFKYIVPYILLVFGGILLFLFFEHKKNLYLYELLKKIDEFSEAKKIAFILANEVKNLLNAQFVCVIEYTYSKSKILSAIPQKQYDLKRFSPHEVFYILKTLQTEKNTYINEDDIQSEHLKQYFPLYSYNNYKIFPVYSDDIKIITLEIYGNIKKVFYLKINTLNKIIEIFQKIFARKIALQQDNLKTKANETIIKFLDRIRYTLDEDELEKIILEEISHSFDADRAFFIKSYSQNPLKPRMGKEYLANPYTKSLRGNNLDYESVWEQLKETQINPPVFVIENSDLFLKQNNLEGSAIDIFIKSSHIKSSYPFLIYQDEKYSMYLVLQFTRKIVIFDKGDFEMMELLSKQTHQAIAQAKLYTKLTLNSKEEKLIIDLISTLRSSFSINKIAGEFSAKVGTFFEAMRCVIRFFDSEKNEFKGYNEAFEYKRNYDISGTKDMNLQKELGDFLLNSEKFHDVISISYSNDLLNKDFEYKDDILNYFERYGLKAYMTAFVRYNGKLFGFLSLHFDEDFNVKKEQEALLKALADQLGIAVYQSELYTNVENTAKKEKLLKEVYADSAGFDKKEEIYKYFSEKLFDILSPKAIFFAEFEEISAPKYFEYYKDTPIEISKIKNSQFFKDIVEKRDFLYYCNLKSEENKEISSFTDNTGIVCIGTIPVFDELMIIFFFDEQRELSPFAKNIMTSLVAAISQTLKEVIQRSEIKSLRETFLSTLTHDLQVPVVAQRNAIDYLKSRNISDEKSQEILKYLAETNEQTEDMIKILSEIYRYEAGIKTLNKISFDACDTLDEILFSLDNLFKINNLKIIKNNKTCKREIFGDKIEFQKILDVLIRYIVERAEGKNIFIDVSSKENRLIFCISANFASTSAKFDTNIFERDIVASKLDRLVGEGIHLYLAKLIALAHDGRIYINETHEKQLSLCVELPVI